MCWLSRTSGTLMVSTHVQPAALGQVPTAVLAIIVPRCLHASRHDAIVHPVQMYEHGLGLDDTDSATSHMRERRENRRSGAAGWAADLKRE